MIGATFRLNKTLRIFMEARNKGGRPRVTKAPARVQVIVEDEIARRLKIVAIERGVLPTAIYREALTEFAKRCEAEGN
jgi:hypothetical protein